jgi:hypothetical protein
MTESGADHKLLYPVMDKLIAEGVQPNGGIAYGYDFEYAPDADDTGLLILLLSKFGERYEETIDMNKKFLVNI